MPSGTILSYSIMHVAHFPSSSPLFHHASHLAISGEVDYLELGKLVGTNLLCDVRLVALPSLLGCSPQNDGGKLRCSKPVKHAYLAAENLQERTSSVFQSNPSVSVRQI